MEEEEVATFCAKVFRVIFNSEQPSRVMERLLETISELSIESPEQLQEYLHVFSCLKIPSSLLGRFISKHIKYEDL